VYLFFYYNKMLRRFFTNRFVAFFTLLILLWLGAWWLLVPPVNPPEITTPSVENPAITKPIISETQKNEQKRTLQMKKERANDALLSAEAKKERATLLAKKADYLWLNSEYHDALDIYERVISLSPQDDYKKKAASIAFEAKEFTKSIEWYTETQNNLTLREKDELLMSMRYVGDKEFQNTLSKIDLPAYIKQAYEVSWICENTFIDCESSIKKYWFDYRPINALKKALDDFKNLQNTDVNYKEALLIGAFYQNKDYSTVIRIGSNLLSRRPDYRPVLKIVGFSAFLTNQYERAENALKKYKTLDSKDSEVDFILGLMYFAREDYKLSNLYFNNAIIGGYKPKNIVERKLAYNYGILGLNANMFQVLGHLVESTEATDLDITNAIYLALTEKQFTLAEKWIKIGIEKSPDSPDILSLRAWHLRLNGNVDTALILLNTILAKDPNHLIALVQAGIIHQEKWEIELAKPLLEKASNIDTGGIWADTIESYLSKDVPKKNQN